MKTEQVKILLTGGGTGGHIFPGIVIADEIRRLHPQADILFVGTRRGLESKVVPRQGYDIEYVDVRYFVRSLSPRNFLTAFKALTAIFQAGKIIKKFRPHVVIGTGGYVSGPVVAAAVMARIPTLIHEQNAFPGLTTRLLAKRVDKVAVSHPEAVKRVQSGARIVVTGHPVRRDFYEIGRQQARAEMKLGDQDKLILVVGGSGGAEKINRVTLDAAKAILANPRNILLHVTGNRYYSWVSAEREKLHLSSSEEVRYRLVDFIHDIPRAMAACDLIVARSGGMVHEMTAAGCPALLIPSPNVTDDHQLHNAMSMAEKGAAILIEEKDLSSERFSAEIIALLDNPLALEDMAAAARKLGKPEAGSRLAKIALQMANN